MWDGREDCWLLGDWPKYEIRTTQLGRWHVAVIGPCGAPAGDVERLVTHGVPDEVTWRWPGSYVVVQVAEGNTDLWTDLGGAWPLYTLAADGGIYWASSSRALAALTDHRLDEHRLTGSLLCPSVSAAVCGHSTFAGIAPIPAGHRARLVTAGRVELQRVWRPKPCAGDHAARLRHELAAAVAVRVDAACAPTTDLSGGYDSTALALLAAEHLKPDRTMIAVTAHPEGITDGGDLTYARSAAAHHPGVKHQWMPLTVDYLPYTALDALPVTDEPAPSTIAYARFSAQLRWMSEQFNSDCHLTGDGGDGLLTTPPAMLAELVARRRYRRALAETIAWARLRRIAVWPLLLDVLRDARRRPGDLKRWLPTANPPAWATRRALDLAAEAGEQQPSEPRRADTAELIAEAMAVVGRTARADTQLAERHGIALHNPFTDSRVIDTYLAVPLDVRPGPAQFKPILRAAMHDLFPPELAARTTKGTFTADYYGGIRANLPDLLVMANGRLADAGLVDPTGLRQVLSLAAAGVPAAFATVEPVIAAEAWLRSLDVAAPVSWEPSHAHQGGGAA